MIRDSETSTMDPEDRRKHLDYIQAVITRMSAASSTVKGWLLPVATATYGYALTKDSQPISLLGIAAVLIFSLLDANYLRQERSYRVLYDCVARQSRPVPLFSLNPTHALDPSPPSVKRRQKLRRLVQRWVPGRSVWLSWAVAPFYGGLIVVGIAAFFGSA